MPRRAKRTGNKIPRHTAGKAGLGKTAQRVLTRVNAHRNLIGKKPLQKGGAIELGFIQKAAGFDRKEIIRVTRQMEKAGYRIQRGI